MAKVGPRPSTKNILDLKEVSKRIADRVVSLSELQAKENHSILLVGPPGSGKSTILRDLPRPLLVLDLDHKFETLPSMFDKTDVFVWRTDKPLVGENLLREFSLKMAPKQEPEGYLEIANMVSDLADMGDKIPYKSVAVDSITPLQDHMVTLLLWNTSKQTTNPHTEMQIQDWGFFLARIREFVNVFQSIKANTVVTAHEKLFREQTTGRIDILPAIMGDFKYRVAGYYSEAYRSFAKTVNNKTAWYLRLRPEHRVTWVKTSFENLDDEIPSRLTHLFDKDGNPIFAGMKRG